MSDANGASRAWDAKAAELLDELGARDIRLWAEGDRLRFRAPKDALTSADRQALAAHKEAMLAELRRRAAVSVQTLPQAYSQRALWYLYQAAPESAAYNVPFVARALSAVGAAAPRLALQTLIDRHPALRTTFVNGEDGPEQRIRGHREAELREIDAASWSAAELSAGVARDFQRPFDLARGPLLRGSLYRCAGGESVLLLTMHHIAVDGASLLVLLQELRAILAAQAAGASPALPPAGDGARGASYGDFVRWQRELLDGAEGRRLAEYWREQLAGEPPPLELPADRPRPVTQTYAGAVHFFELDEGLTERLKAMARHAGATLYVVLLAAHQALLHRLTGQEDILVGSPTWGRSRPEFTSVVGDFINMIVLRGRPAGELRFSEFLEQLRQTVLGAMTHQDYPFPLLVEELQPERDPSRSPVFQASFVLQKFEQSSDIQEFMAASDDGARLDFGGLTLAPFAMDFRDSQFDLSLEMSERSGRLPGILRYNTDLFDAATVARWKDYFERLLEAVVDNPELRLGEIPLLSEDERRQLLVAWNDTTRDVPPGCLPRWFAEQAERTPRAVAVAAEDGEFTYAALAKRAGEIGALLRASGAGPGTIVGLCLERSREMVAALLGVLQAGAAYLPLDPAFPRERLSFMLEDSGAALLLTAGNAADGLRAPTVLNLDDVSAANPQASFPNPQSQDLAYVIYTSGSTGKPKGVAVTHGALANFLDAMRERPGLAAGEGLLAVTTLSFDIAALELFLPLIVGGRIELASRETVVDGRLLLARLAESRPAVLQATPATWRLLLEADWTASPGLRAWCGGEALPRELAAALLERVDPAGSGGEVWNLYGPTETTIWSSVERIVDSAAPISIGRPLANTRFYILDKHLRLAPVGVAGELCIGGAGLAREYLNRPELTAERFIDWRADESAAPERLYRTGDLARRLADGRVECLGRLDHQVKVRGFRIELGEIEAALTAQPGVDRAVVAAREDGPPVGGLGDVRLVAYIVSATDSPPTLSELRPHLREFLPEYMLPSALVLLDEFPLTPNGKVDRRALPAPERQAGDEEYAPPSTPSEEIMAGIWATLLNLERVGARQNFFALGGHSLLATQVLSRVRDAFGLELPLRAIFEAPTVEALARRVDDARQGREGAAPPPITRVDRDGDLPLSFSQERMWFLYQLMPDGNAYNIPAALRLRGPLDAAALERAFDALARRHESLRTTFGDVGGRPMQRIAASPNHGLAYVDLCEGPLDGRRAEALRRAGEENRRPFDLARGPLLRIFVYRLADEEHLLLLSMHHIISDMWSLGVLAREFAVLYGAETGGAPAELPALDLQYADYAHWQRQWLSGAELERQLAYWRPRLEGAPILELPGDRPRPAVREFRGASASLDFPPALVQTIQAAAAREGVTPFMLLLAVFKVLLWRHARQDDVVVGAPVANRTRSEVEGTVGAFINTLALRTDLSGDPSFRELLGRVRETTLGAYAHQELPFEKLVEELHPERDMSHTPLVQVLFNFSVAALDDRLTETMAWTPEEVARGAVQFDLTVLADLEALPGIYAEYDVDLFGAATIERLLGHYRTLLVAAAAAPERRISQLPLMDDDERRWVLVDRNETQREYPTDVCLHQLFEAQVRRAPDAAAVIADGEGDGEAGWSYRELDDRANRLAAHLRELGVGPDSLVGVCMERSLELVAALLGVLKAGGAYVPLDPSYPEERLRFMLQDAQAQVLLTQSQLAESLPFVTHQIRLDEAWPAAAAPNPQSPIRNLQSSSLAYVIYTSGSTGRPKGVAVPHRAIVNHMQWMQEAFPLTADDCVLQKTPMSFDASVWEFFAPLLAGATLALARPGGHQDVEYLPRAVRRRGVTILQVVPTLLGALLETDALASCSSLRRVFSGGEALTDDLRRRFFERTAGERNVELVNLYGPTEACIDATFHVCRQDESNGASGATPIGRPIANLRAYVLDEELQPAPVGVAGELYLGGAGLARGYLQRPELTAERFVADPFRDEADARLYRTGDLARWLPGGELDFLGRIDQQVKLRGYRIELGEIEAVLRQEASVKEAAVVVREYQPGDERLVAYLTPRDGAEIDTAALRDRARRQLPDYMAPAALVVLDALPLTPSGKLDRRALPAPEGAQEKTSTAYEAPQGETERAVAEIWQGVLKLERVGRRDGFFELGGHSLLATQAISRLRERFQLELPIRAVFEAPSAAAMGELIETLRWAAFAPAASGDDEREELEL